MFLGSNYLTINAQSSTLIIRNIDVPCFHPPECDGISIQVNTTITDNTLLECGEFDVDVSFDILKGADCIEDPDEDFYRIRWYIGSNYSSGRSTTTHVSQSGGFRLKLEFIVHTVCGQDYSYKQFYDLNNSTACDGCYNAISYCDLFCNPSPEYNDDCGMEYYDADNNLLNQISKIHNIYFIDHYGLVKVDNTNNYGIFTFPYLTRDEGQCPNLQPGLIELVRDMNKLLNLKRTGIPEYKYLSGYVTLMDSYNDPLPEGGVDLCKIRINFVDMGMTFFGFHLIDHFAFDLGECEILEYLNHEDEHSDPRFPHDNFSCLGWDMQANNSKYNQTDYLIELFNEAVEDDTENISLDLETNEIGKIKYFPSISSDYFTIRWDASTFIEMSLIVMNTSGIVVKKIERIKNTDFVTIDIKDLPQGLYFVKSINDINGNISIGKIIKQ